MSRPKHQDGANQSRSSCARLTPAAYTITSGAESPVVLTSNLATVAQTFQKLIFVSNLVFGDQQAAFLLPWERTFKLTKAQLQVAKRDSGKALFKSFLDQRGGQLEVSCCVLPPTHPRGCHAS